MLYYIPAYAPDAQNLRLCLTRLQQLDPDACVIISNDSKQPVPNGALPKDGRTLVIPAPYAGVDGKLHGREVVEGLLSSIIKAMEDNGETHIIKLDCDMWLNSVEWLRLGALTPEGMPEPDYLSLETAEPMGVSGSCVRISIYAARAALKAFRARQWPAWYRILEDQVIQALIIRSRLPVLTIPYTEGHYCGMHNALPGKRELEAWAVHCGEPCADGKNAPRDFITLRMRLMEAICKKH